MTDAAPQPLPGSIEFSDGRFVDPGDARVLIGILTCDKYKGRADGIRNSWLKLLPPSYRVLFIHGRPGQREGVEGDCLFLDCPESYEILPQKVHAFLEYALRHFEFDYLFKTDDDTYLDLERFIAFDRAGRRLHRAIPRAAGGGTAARPGTTESAPTRPMKCPTSARSFVPGRRAAATSSATGRWRKPRRRPRTLSPTVFSKT